jgi:ribosomal protein S18 acetylase RimI-like enzyme
VKVRKIQPQDRGELKALLRAQTHFHPEEFQVALELIDIALAHPSEEDYRVLCAEERAGEVRGYICFGKAPLTDGVYDLYWVVVHPAFWNRGIGSSLFSRTEEELRRRQARLLLIETSSAPAYEGPRAFYRKRGYGELARVLDYYRPGDHKIIFGKKTSF